MAIRVTCPGCHQRFDVSDKFSGREGPCPKCKVVIRIPDKSEQVVIHSPESAGPKDLKGRLVLRPIARSETRLSGVQITLLICGIVLFLSGSLVLRVVFPDASKIPGPIPVLAVALLGPVLAFTGYTFLRDQELGSFTGRELWVRVAICGAVYAASWLLMYVGWYAFNNRWEFGSWISGALGMLLVGGLTGMLAFELSPLSGLMHYGLFFGCSLILRWLAGMGIMPGSLEVSVPGSVSQGECGVEIWGILLGTLAQSLALS